MKHRPAISRRSFLRGAGTVAIALPFLDTMMAGSVFGATPNPPDRVITVFFGLGVPKEYTVNGFSGPLSPLGAFSDKLSLFRNINLGEVDGSANNHFDGGGGVFVGFQPDGEVNAGGPSIDQVIKQELYPNGVPTPIQTLMMGSYFRRTRDGGFATTRFVHSWREDGSPVDLPIESPTDLFDRMFGQMPGTGNEDEDQKRRRYELSVLDSVMEQYRSIQSERSPFGPAARSKIADHLEMIRELEQRALAEQQMVDEACRAPDRPGDLPLLNGQEPDIGSLGPVLQVEDWTRLWKLNCELYAMALRCDITRFGNVMFCSAGERVRLQGDYRSGGELIDTFDDQEATHEYWHKYRPNETTSNNQRMENHMRFMMDQVAYFLAQLDDPNFADENGQTILENSLVMLSTELGNGARHDLENVFHAISGANERFKVGEVNETSASGVDLYNTCLKGMGIENRTMGDPAYFNGTLDTVLDNPY